MMSLLSIRVHAMISPRQWMSPHYLTSPRQVMSITTQSFHTPTGRVERSEGRGLHEGCRIKFVRYRALIWPGICGVFLPLRFPGIRSSLQADCSGVSMVV